MEDTLLKIENVTKVYPGVKALSSISTTIRRGEVRALVGENGAGKSTLIKCIMGVETPTEGKISINCDGRWCTAKNAIEAKELGMHANYQHVNIARELSIAENYYLGRIPKTKLGAVDWKRMYKDSKVIIDKFEMNVDPRAKISELPVAMQAMVTISKISVNDNIRLVIFDEPTALLENDKVAVLFKYIRELKAQGISVIYISHRLEEIGEICDTVTVLKDGCYVDTKDVSAVTKENLVSMMVGREMTDMYNIRHAEPGAELLRVEGLTDKQGKRFRDVSFSVHAGEIVGFFGLVGAGRSEVMRSVFGVSKPASGTIIVRGQKKHIRRPHDAMRQSIGFLTEDRRIDGLALPLSLKINTNMSSYDMISKVGFVNLKKEKQRADKYIDAIDIKAYSAMQCVENLSGGNQQKVVIAKVLCRDPDVLIFDEPTVGVDVGAKEEIYGIIEKLVQDGKGVIIISSYLPEVLGLADRIIVMSEGEVVGELNREQVKAANEESILKMASGTNA